MWHLDDFLAGLSFPQLRRAVFGGCGNVPCAAGRDVEIFDIFPVAPFANHFIRFQVPLRRCAVANAGKRGFIVGRYGCDDDLEEAIRFEFTGLLAVLDAAGAALFRGAGYGDFRIGREIDRRDGTQMFPKILFGRDRQFDWVSGQSKRQPFDLARIREARARYFGLSDGPWRKAPGEVAPPKLQDGFASSFDLSLDLSWLPFGTKTLRTAPRYFPLVPRAKAQ